MAENTKSMADAKTDEEKDKIKTKKQNATTGLRTCNNILTMTKPLHAKAPSFIGDKRINLSWKEVTKTVSPTIPAAGAKRPATAGNGSNNTALKKGRGSGGMQNQLVNRALDGVSGGGRGGFSGGGRGGFSGGGRGGARGRGRGHNSTE
ncbi:apoptosis inhibitor 5-like protein API5 [Cicer arietinum]|uniref:Apoptosis inhibitor 5-like protein API5 n=1 Tax=Cicer arietinum TaxID=3827 RepID=A0A1S3EFV9_CICAR|nr:apoptosis inhibitor 5-like protein API5 [Cicer arietinum]